jgi:signal transduction histidine kinase/AmiR/NasT family two-component response regulator
MAIAKRYPATRYNKKEQEENVNSVITTPDQLGEDNSPFYKKTIAIIRDNSNLQWGSIEKILFEEGFQIYSFDISYDFNFKKLERLSRDLTILDIQNPGLLNIALAQVPPVTGAIIITDRDDITFATQLPCRGFKFFLVEPFSRNKLFSLIENSLKYSEHIVDNIERNVLKSVNETAGISTPNIKTFAKVLLNDITSRIAVDYASCILKNEDNTGYNVMARYGIPEYDWDSIYRDAIKSRETITVGKVFTPFDYYDHLPDSFANISMIWLPVMIEEKIMGVVNLVKEGTINTFKNNDIEFARIIISRNSTALEHLSLSNRLKKQQKKTDELKGLLLDVYKAQIDERRRMAAEIHDGVAQWLAGAAFDIETTNKLLADNRYAEAAKSLDYIKNLMHNSVRELRRAIAGLRAQPLVEHGFIGAIKQSIANLEREKINCKLEVIGEMPVLNNIAIESNIYWIVQEALTNIHKHAKAGNAIITIECTERKLTIYIKDDGLGFDPKGVVRSSTGMDKIGLLGMQDRAKLICGDLTIKSAPGKGTTCCLIMPLKI